MSSDILDYGDLLIDYMDEIVKNIPNFNGSWNPSVNKNLVLSNDDISINTTAEITNKLLSFNNIVGLNAEEIYRTISELSIEDLNLFSPNIQIYRRVPSYLSVNEDGVKSNEIGNYIYKKFDFIDGSNILGIENEEPRRGRGRVVPRTDIDKEIFEGRRGAGLATITDASWELEPSADAYEQNTEKFDFLGKTTAGISTFSINFKFDSPMTFFGNNSDLISKFMRDPVNSIEEMNRLGIEGNEITRNYAYLMFLSDFTQNNNSATIDANRNNESFHFLIKVGYSPLTYNIDDIISDTKKRDIIKKFNSLLLNYEDYINLVFECKLSTYDFEFAKDNSLKLKCKFIGIVRQGSLRDLYSNRTNEMNFFNSLYSGAISTKLQRYKKVSNLIDKYNSLKRYGCDVDETLRIARNDELLRSSLPGALFNFQTYEEIQSEYEQLNNELQQERINNLSNFLTDVNINLLVFTSGEQTRNLLFPYKETIINNTSSLFNSNLITPITKASIKIDSYTSASILSNEELLKRASGESTFNVAGAESLSNLTSGEIVIKAVDTTIPFFFFGDLVDNIIKKFKLYHSTLPSNDLYKNFTCFMPNLTVYKRTRNMGSSIYKMIENEASKQIINAAFVPITMDLWRKWCHENIIKKQRKYYHLLDLLNDLKKLLTSAINYKTQLIIDNEPILKSLGNRPLLYSSFYETKYDIQKGQFTNFLQTTTNKNRITTGDTEVNIFRSLNLSTINPLTDPEPVNLCGYTTEIITNDFDNLGSLVASDDSADSSNSYILSAGNYEKDVKNKIAHFFIGNQLGLAKDFSFTNNPAPRAREIALEDGNTAIGFKNINYLSVTIRLVGSNFFRPMEIIYVHPHYTFGEPFDNSFNMSNILNIGGYYVIQKISSNFSTKGVYETTIEAKYYVHAQNEALKKKCDSLLKELESIWKRDSGKL